MPTNSDLEVTHSTPTAYNARDRTDHRFFVSAILTGGMLSFTVVARLANGQMGAVSGKEFLDAMMAHFGANVSKIQGHWVAGIDLDTNIEQFNTYTGSSHNLSDDDAAKQTWTGERAAEHGFTAARVTFKDPPNAPGNYVEVYAEFTRP